MMQTLAGPARNRGLLVLAMLAGGLLLPPGLALAQPRRPPARPSLPEGAQMHTDIEYARVDDISLRLDLLLPAHAAEDEAEAGESDQASSARPALVVWIHGGGWRSGSKRQNRAAGLVAEGFAVASIDYRLSGQAKFPAQIHDCKAAIRFLRAKADEYGYDGSRIGVWGSSAGGHLVALLGTSIGNEAMEGAVGEHRDQSSAVQAVCDWFGPTDLAKMDEQAGPGGSIRHNAPNSPEAQLIGGLVEDHPAVVRAINPITYVSGNEPPFLIMHGTEDRLVPIGQSELLYAALKQAEADVKFIGLDGAGHGGPGFNDDQVTAEVVSFFRRALARAPEGSRTSDEPASP